MSTSKFFKCNTSRTSRICCKQRTCTILKSFRCSTYKKQGEGAPTTTQSSSRAGTSEPGYGLGSASLLDEVQRPLQFQFEFCALWQVQFMPAARLHEVRCECSKRSTFRSFFLVFMLHAFHGANRRARCGRFCGVMLIAGSSFDQSFLSCAGFYAV